MMENLRLLARLYLRPTSAMSAIIDEGSLLFGAAAVLAVSVLTGAAMYLQVAPAYAFFMPAAAPRPATASPGPAAASPGPASADEDYDTRPCRSRRPIRARGPGRGILRGHPDRGQRLRSQPCSTAPSCCCS